MTEEQWRAMVSLVHASGLLEGGAGIADRLQRALPDHPNCDAPYQLTEWRENAAVFVIGALQRRVPAADEDDSRGAELGRARAHAGVPVAALLQSVMIQQRICFEVIHDLLPPTPYRSRIVLELLSRLQNWANWFMIGLTDGHRGAELAISRRAQELQDSFVWQLITGTSESLEDGSGIEAYGLSRTEDYHAFRASVRSEGERSELEAYLALVGPNGRRIGMMAWVNGDLCGFTATLPTGPTPPVPIGISAARPLQQLPTAFRQATRALEAIRALGRREVASLESVGLHAAVVADKDVGKLLYDRYLAPVLALGPPGDTIVETARAFVQHCGRLEPTARELDVHPNTVRYRLARFESVTGASLHSSDTIAEIWWAMAWRAVPGALHDTCLHA